MILIVVVSVMLSSVDKCMTDVTDSTCTASYGASANLVSSGGKSIVGNVTQLSEYLLNFLSPSHIIFPLLVKPVMVTCGLGLEHR